MNQEAPAAFSAQVLESSTIDMGSLGTPYASCTVTGFYPTPVPVTPEPTPAADANSDSLYTDCGSRSDAFHPAGIYGKRRNAFYRG